MFGTVWVVVFTALKLELISGLSLVCGSGVAA